MTTKENNSAFIDGQNLHLGTKELPWNLDYKKFRTYLLHKYRVQEAYYFLGYIKRYRSLYKSLREAGFILIFKETVENGGKIKGNVDTELVLHAMDELCKDSYDKAVLVTSDGDFLCLAKHLDERSKLKAIVSPHRKPTSKLLTRNQPQLPTSHSSFKQDLLLLDVATM